MNTLAKCTLSAAVAAIVSVNAVQAAEITTVDPSFKLTYKNYYWKEKDSKNPQNGSDIYRDEWVHGIVADFDTGYINNMMGAVVTAGFADPLDVQKNTSISNVAKGSDGKANGIAGVQQAYLKAKYEINNLTVHGSFGVKKRGYALYGNSGSRLLAASSYGYDLSANYMDATLYASHITGASDRNASAFKNDLTVGKDNQGKDQKLDSIDIIGVNYTLMGVGLNAERLVSEEYLKKHFYMVDYTFDLGNEISLATDVRYATAEKEGKLLTSGDYIDDKGEYESSYYNLNATLNIGHAYVGAGYNKTSEGDWAADDSDQGNAGTFNSSLSQWADYALEGEKAYLITAGYNFADFGLAGLSINAYAAKGENAKNYKSDFDRREWSTSISYAFDGVMDGLALRFMHTNYKFDGTKTAANSEKESDREKINRVYLTYTINAF